MSGPCLCGDPDCRRCFPGGKYEPPELLIDLVNQTVDEAIQKRHDRTSGESFVFCGLCGEWEDHTPDCPIPWLDSWLASGEEKDASVPGHVRTVKRYLKLLSDKSTPQSGPNTA